MRGAAARAVAEAMCLLLKAEGKDWAAFGELLKAPRLLARLCSYDLGAIPPAARGVARSPVASP